MIASLRIEDAGRACTPWWSEVEALSGLEQLDFEPGLNILWGPNGSGKSTVLTAIARMLHAEQGGRSVVTESSIRQVFPLSFVDDGYLGGLALAHDGQAVLYIDPESRPGVTPTGHFDYDFFDEAFDSLQKRSSGQKTLSRANTAFAIFTGHEAWPEIGRRIQPEHVNDLWRERLRLVEQSLSASIPKGSPTVLMDEPDRSLDLPTQANLWQRLPETAACFQLLVATHCPFAVHIEGAHYIDLVPGYLEHCRRAVSALTDPP